MNNKSLDNQNSSFSSSQYISKKFGNMIVLNKTTLLEIRNESFNETESNYLHP